MNSRIKKSGMRDEEIVNLSLHSNLRKITAETGTNEESIRPDMKLLLLDDDTGSASRLIELLEENSLITKFDTGFPDEAASLLSRNHYDVLLVTLPTELESIYEVIEINRANANIPVVLVSDRTDPAIHFTDSDIVDIVSISEPENLIRVLRYLSRELSIKRKLDSTHQQLSNLQSILNSRNNTQPAGEKKSVSATDDLSQLIFTSISESIAVIDCHGTILQTNQHWKNLAPERKMPVVTGTEGMNYLETCRKTADEGDELSIDVLKGVISVINGSQAKFELEHPCHSDTNRCWYLLRVTPFYLNGRGALIMHINITDKKNKELELEFSYKELLSAEKINQALVSNESTEKLADYMLQSLYETAGVQRSRIYLYNKKEDKLELFAHRISGELAHIIERRTGVQIHKLVPEIIEGNHFYDVVKNQQTIFTHDPKLIRALVSEHTSNPVLKKLAAWAQKLAGIKTFGLFPLKNGEELIGVLSIATPIKLNDREQKTVFRFAQYVSLALSKKLDQEELLHREEKFKAISNYTANWETWIDRNGKPIWINPAVINHSGYTPEELLAMPDFYGKIIHKEDYPLVMATLQDALIHKTDGDNLEFRCYHKNGSINWFSVSWKQAYDTSGKWLGIRSSGKDITERKKQELELIRKKEELKEVQEIARLSSWEWQVDKGLVVFSDYLSRVLGLRSDTPAPIEEALVQKVNPGSRETLERIIRNPDELKPGSEFELKVNDVSGGRKYFLVRASFNSENTAPRPIIRGSALDITELRNTYEQVRKSEDRFRKIFDSIQDVYYQTDMEGIITMVSPSVYSMLGYTPEEVIGRPISMLYVKPKLQELRMARRHLMGDNEQFEGSLLAKSGDEVVVSINLNFLNGVESGQRVVQGMMRNITEKKKQEKSLENQRKRLLEIVKLNTQIIQTSDHFYYVIQVTDLETKAQQLKYVSSPVTSILGLTELDLLNRDDRWQSLIHPEDTTILQQAIDHVFSLKKPQHVSYRIMHNRSQEIIWVDDYICPLLNGNNDVVEIYGSVKDVSERVNLILKIEEEKKQSMAYQYQLLSSQLNPHFIYNTLNTFQYYILQGNIEESLNHISDFSKLMRKVLENSMYNYISLDEEIEFLEHYMRISRQRMKQPLEFSIEVDDDVETGDVMIPPMLLQPYLENAMIHGFNECPRKPFLRLLIRKRGQLVECVIEDNGIGREKSIRNKGNRPAESKRSYAMGINKNRIDLLNQITDRNFEVLVEDLKDENNEALGTRVFIRYQEIITDFQA